MGGVGGVKKCPPFFWVENHESFGFFQFLAEKVFPGPDSIGFVWGGVGRAPVPTRIWKDVFCGL